LRPRLQSFDVAIDAYRAGRFVACVGATRMHETPAAHVLRARALLRLGRPADAASEIDAVLEPMGSHPEDARTLSFEQLGELHTLRATARVRCHRFPDADDSFLSARVYTYSSGNAALEAELAYYEAHYAQAAGARIEFEAWARAVLAVHPEPVSVPARPAYFVPLEHSRARAYDLLGFIAAEAHDFREQARRLRSSLEEFDRTTVRDAWFEAKQLAHLSYYVRDFGDEDVAEYVLQRYGCTEWTAELAAQQQEVLRSLGWSTAMRGDFLSAFRFLRDAAEIAPTIPYKISAILDRAYLSCELQLSVVAREEVDYAERLAARVCWNDVHAEAEIVALLQLSAALAPIDAPRARLALERYRTLKKTLPTSALAHGDPRVRAEELAAQAAILRAEGFGERAKLAFVDSFETWRSLGCAWQAALVARELTKLGAGAAFASCTAAEARRHPASWLAARSAPG